MSQEKLNHVVAGVLNDFVAYLTTRKERLMLSSADNAVPAVEAMKEFLAKRGIEDSDPLFDWPARCSRVPADEDTKEQK